MSSAVQILAPCGCVVALIDAACPPAVRDAAVSAAAGAGLTISPVAGSPHEGVRSLFFHSCPHGAAAES